LCAAAYIIKCTATGHEAIGSVVECSEAADNYRAEILGAVLLQLVLPAATTKKHLPYQTSEVFCDNRGVVSCRNSSNTILPEKQAQADVLRVLKQYVRELPVILTFVWVKAHQDDHVAFDDLELIAQLNVRVDRLAKWTLKGGIVDQVFICSNFSFEEVRILIGAKKVTKAPKATLNRYWSTMTARDLYHEQ